MLPRGLSKKAKGKQRAKSPAPRRTRSSKPQSIKNIAKAANRKPTPLGRLMMSLDSTFRERGTEKLLRIDRAYVTVHADAEAYGYDLLPQNWLSTSKRYFFGLMIGKFVEVERRSGTPNPREGPKRFRGTKLLHEKLEEAHQLLDGCNLPSDGSEKYNARCEAMRRVFYHLVPSTQEDQRTGCYHWTQDMLDQLESVDPETSVDYDSDSGLDTSCLSPNAQRPCTPSRKPRNEMTTPHNSDPRAPGPSNGASAYNTPVTPLRFKKSKNVECTPPSPTPSPSPPSRQGSTSHMATGDDHNSDNDADGDTFMENPSPPSSLDPLSTVLFPSASGSQAVVNAGTSATLAPSVACAQCPEKDRRILKLESDCASFLKREEEAMQERNRFLETMDLLVRQRDRIRQGRVDKSAIIRCQGHFATTHS